MTAQTDSTTNLYLNNYCDRTTFIFFFFLRWKCQNVFFRLSQYRLKCLLGFFRIWREILNGLEITRDQIPTKIICLKFRSCYYNHGLALFCCLLSSPDSRVSNFSCLANQQGGGGGGGGVFESPLRHVS